MLGSTFYYKSFRNATVAFGQLFSNITIHRQNSNDEIIKTIKIPLLYTEKENFISILVNDKVDNSEVDLKETLPRMGYSISNIQYDAGRKLNTMEKLARKDNEAFMFNRVPYEVSFELFIGTRRIDDGYRIIEQILPYFTPELNVRIKENSDSDIISNIPYVLTDVQQDVVINTMEERRNVMWTLSFTAKLHLYAAQRNLNMIRRTVIDINDVNSQELLEQYLSSVDPINSGINDDWSIEESISRHSFYDFIISPVHGATMEFDFDMYEMYHGSALDVALKGFPLLDGNMLSGSELEVVVT